VQWIASLLFTVWLFLWTFSYAVFFVLASLLLPFRGRYVLAQWYGHSVLTVLRWTCGLDYRVEGLHNLPAAAHVALWKHSSAWETFAQFVIGPAQVIVLKRELMWLPFFGWGLALLRSIAIDRGAGASAVNQVVKQGTERLNEGISVLVFPEGTRVAAGETRKYGVSGALLASRAGCKIVPIAHDAGYYWPRRGLLKKRGAIQVRIGAPIDAAGRDAREINAEVQAWMEKTIAELRAASVAATQRSGNPI
jgi:1-acyl-sn-glycerol-3-phosphate acyltransferase